MEIALRRSYPESGIFVSFTDENPKRVYERPYSTRKLLAFGRTHEEVLQNKDFITLLTEMRNKVRLQDYIQKKVTDLELSLQDLEAKQPDIRIQVKQLNLEVLCWSYFNEEGQAHPVEIKLTWDQFVDMVDLDSGDGLNSLGRELLYFTSQSDMLSESRAELARQEKDFEATVPIAPTPVENFLSTARQNFGWAPFPIHASIVNPAEAPWEVPILEPVS